MAFSTSGQEFQHIQDILKDSYAPAIINQVYKKAPVWAQIKTKYVSAGGKRVVIPVRTALTEAVGAKMSNDYSLPTALKTSYDQTYVYMKRNYGRVQVDGFAIESSKGKGGWIDVMTGETRSAADAFAIDIDQQSMGNGTGILGHVLSLATPAITFNDPHGITDTASTWHWFRPGMELDIFDYSDGTEHESDVGITSISGKVLTMDEAITGCAVGDYLVRANSFVESSGSPTGACGSMMGIEGIVGQGNIFTAGDSGYFQGIDATSEETWQSYVGGTTGTLTETKIQVALDEIEKNTDMSPPNLCITTTTIRNKLIEIVRSDRMISDMKFNAGWEGIKYTGGATSLKILTHRYCPVGYMYFLAMPHIKFYALKKLVWDNKGGGIIKPVAGYDAYEAWFKMYGNIGTDARNAHGKLTGVTT